MIKLLLAIAMLYSQRPATAVPAKPSRMQCDPIVCIEAKRMLTDNNDFSDKDGAGVFDVIEYSYSGKIRKSKTWLGYPRRMPLLKNLGLDFNNNEQVVWITQ